MAGQCFLCFIRPIRHTDFSLFLRFLARTYFIYKVIKTSASPANPITFPLFFAFSKTPLRFKRNVLVFQTKRTCVSNEMYLCFKPGLFLPSINNPHPLHPSVCSCGQFTRYSTSVARVKAVYNHRK